MTWFRLPLFVWAQYATSLVMILGTPVVAITLVLVAAERTLHLGIFDPKLGGDPVLFQHLFWFYSHPAVYIMILPGMGVISELVAAMSRKQIFGYGFVAFSSLAIAILGFLVWGHHLFVSSQSIYAGLVFSIITMLVAVPSAVKTFNWAATMYKGSISWESPTYWVIGFMGLFLDRRPDRAVPRDDGPRHPPARHVLRRRALPLHHGRRRDHGVHGRPALLVAEDDRPDVHRSRCAKASAILVFVGFNLTFFPQFILGYLGHAAPLPRVSGRVPGAGTCCRRPARRFSALGYLLPSCYLTYSLFKGEHGAGQSVGREGPRVDDVVAAADVQLRRGPDRDRAGVQLQAGARRCTLADSTSTHGRRTATPRRPRRRRTRITRSCSTTSTAWSSSSRRPPSGCGCSSSPKSCSSAACSWPTSSTATMYPEAWVAEQPRAERLAGRRSTPPC